MKWFILVVGLVVICFVAALLLGFVRGGGMGAPTSSLRHEPLPDAPLTDDDLAGLQFDVTARGYRMSEVDGVIDRLRRELRDKDDQIAVLRGDVQRSLTRPGSRADGETAASTASPVPMAPAAPTDRMGPSATPDRAQTPGPTVAPDA